MDQEHDNVETGPEDAGVVALDEQVEQAATEAEVAEEQDEPEDQQAEPARPGRFEPDDPTMLLGEARDHVLGAIKRSPAWGKLNEKDQRYLTNEVEQAQRRAIVGIVRVTASMDLDAVEVTLSKPTLTDNDQIEAKIIMGDDENAWMRLREQNKCTLVFGGVSKLLNARAAEVQKDQPGLFDMGETAEQRAKREAIDAEAAEHEARQREAAEQERLLAGFKPTDPPTIDNATGEPVADAPPPALTVAPEMTAAERAAYDRGVARRAHGGAKTLPEDLMDKDMVGDSAEARAFHAGYDAPLAEPESAAAVPKRRRGRKTVDQAVAERQASLVGA